MSSSVCRSMSSPIVLKARAIYILQRPTITREHPDRRRSIEPGSGGVQPPMVSAPDGGRPLHFRGLTRFGKAKICDCYMFPGDCSYSCQPSDSALADENTSRISSTTVMLE